MWSIFLIYNIKSVKSNSVQQINLCLHNVNTWVWNLVLDFYLIPINTMLTNTLLVNGVSLLSSKLKCIIFTRMYSFQWMQYTYTGCVNWMKQLTHTLTWLGILQVQSTVIAAKWTGQPYQTFPYTENYANMNSNLHVSWIWKHGCIYRLIQHTKCWKTWFLFLLVLSTWHQKYNLATRYVSCFKVI
jgi:hypothetical protein